MITSDECERMRKLRYYRSMPGKLHILSNSFDAVQSELLIASSNGSLVTRKFRRRRWLTRGDHPAWGLGGRLTISFRENDVGNESLDAVKADNLSS